jgi:hypothetical protein
MAIVKISDLPLVDSPVEGTDLFVVVQDNVTKKAFASDIQTYVGFEEFQTATAGQTVFNLTTMTYAAGANNLMVFVDGVNQYEGASYLETDNNTVTFTQGLHEGALVKFSTVQTQTSSVANSGAVTFLQAGTGAVNSNAQNKMRQFVNVLDFVPPGEQDAIINGTSTYDISNAIRYAIDSLGPNGGTVYFPNGGAAKVNSTVYIPPKGYGVTLLGNKFAITGGGVGTHSIFETGMPGNSFGGSSNWSAPNESVLNAGLIIRDFVFLECGTAIKVFNAIWRSEFSGNWAYQNVSTLLHAKRCFYSKTLNNTAIIGRSDRGASEPVYWFEEVVNVQTIMGNSASGNWGGVNKSGIGYLFTGGMAGLSFANNSAESCVTGMKITSEVTGAEITGCYFELLTTAIDLGSASKSMDIGGCYFYSNITTAITSAGGWVAGTLKANNSVDPAVAVDLSAASNSCTVERPLVTSTLTTAYANYEIVPASWTLSSSIVVRRPASTYDAAGGQNAQRALMSEMTNGAGLVALPYAGDLGAPTGANPAFCSTTVGATDVTVDTKIAYRANGGAQFTAVIADNSATWKVAGAVRFGDTVYRLDATGITVVASDNSGYLRLVFGNFTAPISVSDIRVWIG